MKLGNILSTAKTPVCCKVVRFQVLGTDDQGRPVREWAEASLSFVDEDKREEYKRYAREWLEAGDYKGKIVPDDVLAEEEFRWFLMAALRDKDNEAHQFCLNSDYGKFRRALVLLQVNWLLAEYRQFVKDEYPELLPKAEQERLAKEAAGK